MSGPQAAMAKFLPWIIGPISIIFTLKFPASVQLFFAAAGGLQYLQTTMFRNSYVRRLAGLPELERVDDTDQQPRRSPFVQHSGGGPVYQAPRTIKTTATEQPSPGSLGDLKQTWTDTIAQRRERKEEATLQEESKRVERERKQRDKAEYQERVRKALEKKGKK